MLRGVLTVALLVAVGCGGDVEAPRRMPDLELGLTQLLPEEGTDRALLRVINREAEPIEVTAVGLSWDGYGTFLEVVDGVKVVPAESELMLRMRLPAPRCTADGSPPESPVEGRVTVGGDDVTRPLTDAAQVYVRRLWQVQCDQELLAGRVRIQYADRPRQVGGAGGDAVETALVLSRVEGEGPVRVTAAGGSVLYDLRLAGRTRLRAGEDSVRVPLVILPGNRCDEHAIGQATAPYDFSVTLRLGGREVLHAVEPPLATQRAASAMLRRHCR